jgi:hypothetical protein
MARRKTGKGPIAIPAGRHRGVVIADEAGRPAVVPYADLPVLIGFPPPGGPTGSASGFAPGMAGQDGEDGWPGAPGGPGTTGAPGAAGATGPAGSPGVRGDDGEDGWPGPQGPQGVAGAAGAPGAAGVSTVPGPPGWFGDDGEDGWMGPPGVAGSAGAAGIAGIAGLLGPPGVRGDDGEDGWFGPPGIAGAAGATGTAGTAGASGSPGVSGDDGEDGWPGTPGTPGHPITIFDQPTEPAAAVAGDLWITDTPTEYTLATTGTVDVAFSNADLIRCTNAALTTIIGLTAGSPGQRVTIVSIGAGQVDCYHQSGVPAAGNCLLNAPTSATITLAPGKGAATYQYDGTTQRWRLITHTQTGPIGASVYTSGALTIATVTRVVLTWDSEKFDTAALHDPAVNPSRLTVPVGAAGTYLALFKGLWQGSGVGQRQARFLINAAPLVTDIQLGSAAINMSNSLQVLTTLVAGDYVEIDVYQDTAGNLDVLAAATFSLQKVA